MADLERFIHDEAALLPALVKAAIAHLQFENIHPFLDGNGRVGRLLIALMLHEARMLRQPLLYLSLYFKQHRGHKIVPRQVNGTRDGFSSPLRTYGPRMASALACAVDSDKQLAPMNWAQRLKRVAPDGDGYGFREAKEVP